MAREKMVKTKDPGVYRTADGSLVARIRVKCAKTGTPIEKSKRIPMSGDISADRRAAVEAAERLRLEARNPTQKKPAAPSLRDYCPAWIERKLEYKKWTAGATTQADRECQLRLHILPFLGSYLLDKITTADLQGWVTDTIRRGTKPTTLRGRWQLLRGIVQAAAREFGFADPVPGVELPKGITDYDTPDLVLEPAQVHALLASAFTLSPDKFYPLLCLGFATGRRASELVSVKCCDLDLSGELGRWRIGQHRVASRILPGGAKVTFHGNKQRKPCFLDPVTTGILRDVVARRRLAGGPDAYLFPSSTDDSPGSFCASTHTLSKFLKKAMPKAYGDRELCPKAFRQTHITLSDLAGVSAAICMQQVGHTSAAVHAIYNRPPPEPREAAARKMGVLLSLPQREPDAAAEVGADSGADPKKVEKG